MHVDKKETGKLSLDVGFAAWEAELIPLMENLTAEGRAGLWGSGIMIHVGSIKFKRN